MNSEFLWRGVASVVATYAIHSTSLLLAAWVLSRWVVRKAAVREWLWKCSTVVPLFSTAFVICWSQSQPVWDWRSDGLRKVVAEAVESEPIRSEATRPKTRPATGSPAEAIEPTPIVELRMPDDLSFPAIEIKGASHRNADDTALQQRTAANDGSDIDEEWTVQIVPGKASADSHTFPMRSQPGATDSVPSSGHSIDDEQLEAVTIATAVTVAAALPKSSGVPGTSQANGRGFASISYPFIAFLTSGLAVLGMIRFIVSQVRIIRIVEGSQEITQDRAATLLLQLLANRNIKRSVRLLSSDVVSEPAATGVVRWTIVLPGDLPARLTDAELSALLCHELGHLVRRDTIWLLFGRLITAVLPWQLLNFVAIQKWQQSAELECDEWALSSNVEALTLAKVLTNVAEWKNVNRLSVGLPATAPPLSLRIEALLNRGDVHSKPRSKFQRLLFTTMLIGTLCGASVFGPRITWASPKINSVVDSPPDSLSPRLTQTEAEELAELQDEFQALSVDLQVALTLLADQEPDPDVDRIIQSITARLKQIEANIHQEGFEQ